MLPECKELLLSLDGGVLSITLNRPHKRNAMNKRLVDEMRAVFAAIADHRSVRAVVLRGAEGNFCAGGDIAGMHDGAVDEAGKPLSPDKAAWQFNRSFGHLITEVNKAPQIVITILEGAVLGGGFGLACVSDIAIAKADAKFAMPETGLGIVPAQIAPFVVMRVGLTQARRLALTGQRIDGAEAQRLGLVHFCADSNDDVDAQLNDQLSALRRCAPAATALTKSLLLDVGTTALEPLLDHASDLFAQCLNGPEGKEGTQAFIEKRKPSWYSERGTA